MASIPTFDIVVPTVGRASLGRLLQALDAQIGPRPQQLIVVDDCAARRGPAAARNRGWRAGDAQWIAFLDDDVLPPSDWTQMLVHDLAGLDDWVGGSQGHIHVPLSSGRRPTDWERNVAGLEQALWASADIAYRREVLEQTGGFDERFRRAYREDSDLALRVQALGYRIAQGRRAVEHPVGPASLWDSVRLQRGNADDALMRALHGRDWHARAGAPAGRMPAHVAVSASALACTAAALTRRPRLAATLAAAALAGVARFAWERIEPGPRTPAEVARMALTSAAIPFAATYHRMSGELHWRTESRRRAERPRGEPCPRAAHSSASDLEAVLFDRDGTLIEDVPYNGDPALVRPRPGAREALQTLRAAGISIGVISNQSAVARGLISQREVQAVNRRVEELVGSVDAWLYCPHGPKDGCKCRKPRPGLVVRAAQELNTRPELCAVVGDIGADVQAARAAGARGVLVPNARTRFQEIAVAPETAPDLMSAVELLLGGRIAAPSVPAGTREPGEEKSAHERPLEVVA